jgi:hypothetical protein
MKLLLAVLWTLLLVVTASAQEVLKAWEFNRDGDTEGWFAAHALAPLVVADGALKTKAIDNDPYMHASRGQAFDIQGNPYQYIEVRMRCDAGKTAEFFWADTTEGVDSGFVAGKERSFPCIPDGQWHTYYVYPGWSGHITRLRMDPPDGATIEIDYIRIVQGPISKHDPASPDFDLSADPGAALASSGGTPLRPVQGGAATEIIAEPLKIVSAPVELKADGLPFVYLELEAPVALKGQFVWTATSDGNFPATNATEFSLPAGRKALNLRLADSGAYKGDLRQVGITLLGPSGTTVTLRRIALSDKPLGTGVLDVASLRATPALCGVGQPARLVAQVCNIGGETLRGAQLRLTAPPGVRLGSAAVQTLRPLAPWESAEVTWTYVPTQDGPATFRVAAGEQTFAATAMVAALPGNVAPPSGPAAGVVGNTAWIGTRNVLLTMGKGARGFSAARLYATGGDKPRLMAALPALAVVTFPGQEGPVALPFQSAEPAQDKDSATLTLNGSNKIGEAQVSLTLKASVRQARPIIDLHYELTTNQPLKLSSFRGPWLWVGEGSFGGKQDQACFPGVEYMEAGERSSSTLDIAPPRNVRFAPHPNTITVPTMAIEKDGAICGLMWNPLQKWDGTHQKPTAVFASPNFVEEHDNHLLGLCLPSIPDFMEPNTLTAAKPVELVPGTPLTLDAAVYAEANSNLLRSMELYFERYGVPDLPPKARSYEDTIAMSLRAYEEILWKEKERGWMPIIGRKPMLNQQVARDYYALASRRLADQEWARKLQEKGKSLADRGDLGWALHEFGSPASALAAVLYQGRAAALSAPEDGRYGFTPTEKTAVLGPAGQSESGICARGVRPLLQKALLTGDQAPLDAALKTLKYMERFIIPRASQVWEVPVHTPDVLASADCCEVYLMAYKLTGDEAMLRRAVYWARTGLPFIYLWQAPEQRPLMLGASIPVFGATFYTGSWFGRPVQWNGLEYARVLIDLDKYDKSLPWRHFAEMITISGINQQSTRPKDYGTYTDNWDVIHDVEQTGCMLAPGRILGNVLDLMGAHTGVTTEIVRSEGKRIAIDSAGAVADARLSNSVLEFKLTYDPGHTAYTTVMPVAEPVQVEVDGVELPMRPDPIDLPQGWSYRKDLGCVTLKLAYDKGPRTVRIIKAIVIEPPSAKPEFHFTAATDPLGWSAAHDVDPLKVEGGRLVVTATGPDPYIYSPAMQFAAKDYPKIVLRLRVTKPDGQLFFTTSKGGWAPVRSVSFQVPADGKFHDVTIDLSGNAEWKDVITQLRLDFAAGPCTAEIEWVRAEKAPAK